MNYLYADEELLHDGRRELSEMVWRGHGRVKDVNISSHADGLLGQADVPDHEGCLQGFGYVGGYHVLGDSWKRIIFLKNFKIVL